MPERVLRSQTRATEQERATQQPQNGMRAWLAQGKGIFVQATRYGSETTHEFQPTLVLSRNGVKTYRLELGQDEMADVNLVINMNFFIERVDRDGSENRTDIDKDGLPSDTKSTSTYADLFYLTARLRGLGLLIGPGTWTLNFWLHENVDNALRVTVARQPRRNIKLEQYLRTPFKFSPETSLRAYVDWKLVEEMIEEAGAEKEFKKFVNGTIYKERLRGYSPGNPPRSPGREAEDQLPVRPLICPKRLVPGPGWTVRG